MLFRSYVILTNPKCHPNDPNKGLIHIAYPLKNKYDSADMQYMIVLSFDSTPMYKLLKQLNPNQEKYIHAYVEDEDGEILMQMDEERQSGNKTQELSLTIGDYTWTIHVVIDKEILQEKVNEMYIQMVFLVILSILLIMLLLLFVTDRKSVV